LAHYLLVVFSPREGRQRDAVDAAGLSVQPLDASEQSSEIAGGADEVVLEPDLSEAAVAGLRGIGLRSRMALRRR
jgi:hypothetical protein